MQRQETRMHVLTPALSVLIALTTATSAVAGNWERIVVADAADIYVEGAAVERRGALAIMRSLTNLKSKPNEKEPLLFRSTIQRDEYDCKGRKMRLLGYTVHQGEMGTGPALPMPSERTNWKPVEPGSWNELKFRIACGVN